MKKGWVREGDFIRRYRRISATLTTDAGGNGTVNVFPGALMGAQFSIDQIIGVRSDFATTGALIAFLNGVGPNDAIWAGSPGILTTPIGGSVRAAAQELIGLRAVNAGATLSIVFTIWGFDEIPADSAGMLADADDDDDALNAIDYDDDEDADALAV